MSSDVTTNFTTTTSSVIRLNPEYLKTTLGIIKLVQLVGLIVLSMSLGESGDCQKEIFVTDNQNFPCSCLPLFACLAHRRHGSPARLGSSSS